MSEAIRHGGVCKIFWISHTGRIIILILASHGVGHAMGMASSFLSLVRLIFQFLEFYSFIKAYPSNQGWA